MPNKSNPDVIEIMRANYALLAGCYSELENLISLPSGYHRDLQLTKRSIIYSINCVIQTLDLLPDLVRSIKVNLQQSQKFIDQGMLMTDQVYELVQRGIPFRDAYIQVKTNSVQDKTSNSLSRKNSSSGSAYNLNLKILKSRYKKLLKVK